MSMQPQSTLSQAEKLADRVAASMQAQGYQEIEYVLSECQLKIVASAPGSKNRTQYLVLPTNTQPSGGQVAVGAHPKMTSRRFVL
ncbi:MAG: hypothetical protein ACU0A6_03695 [Shimia sp.]|uniref:hypothetical protein n=1 Tax=Shimia sp. TaxID=1954381 RepID=UPI004058F7E4